MKKIFLSVFLCLVGMAISAQDLSNYINDFTRADGSYTTRLTILEAVSGLGITGAGEFYHEALKYFLVKTPDISTNEDRTAAERSARIICNSLADEKYTAAAPDLWDLIVFYDVGKPENDGVAMQEALVALGMVGGTDFITHIIDRLDRFNSQTFTRAELNSAQRGVIGCINALQDLHDPLGYRPIFFVTVGSYDLAVQSIASSVLPTILDDPADIISGIILTPSYDPRVKLVAWNEMLKSNAPASSKARVASVALASSFINVPSNVQFQTNLREMRKSAINAIRDFGVSDDSVYNNLERAYSTAFGSGATDYDDILFSLEALSAIKTDEAVRILNRFLQNLHERRRSGPWGSKERTVFPWVVYYLGETGTQSIEVRLLLTTITRDSNYTGQEQRMATNALNALGVR